MLKTGNLYECTCPELNRSRPFRAECHTLIIDHITATAPPGKPLTALFLAPGGLWFEWTLVATLLDKSILFHSLIIIEPNSHIAAIRKAIKEFKKRCAPIDVHHFKNLDEYKKACKETIIPRADILVCIDPDDKATTPNFDSITFRKNYARMIKKILIKEHIFYYLYYQEYKNDGYAHLIIGQLYNDSYRLLHWYGEHSLYDQHFTRTLDI